jgi:hypothetical protein
MKVAQQPRTATKRGPVKPRKALDLPSRLAYLYAPILPSLKWIKVMRRGPRGHDPKDILVPQGYAAEVVATGLNAPVHCCFDEQGFCYVTEAGHKIDSPPRLLKVNVSTGTYETFFELPKEQWNKVGAMTGACCQQGHLYVMNTDTLLRVRPDGSKASSVPLIASLARTAHSTSWTGERSRLPRSAAGCACRWGRALFGAFDAPRGREGIAHRHPSPFRSTLCSSWHSLSVCSAWWQRERGSLSAC